MTSVVSTVALLATTMSASLVSAASEFLPYAQALADNDIIGAQSTEAAYRLGDTVTRAELAKVTANLGGYTPTSCAGNVYSDVKSSLGDLCGYIEALAEAGVVSTSYANFRPSASVTRAEMVKMLLGAVGEAPSTTSAGYMDVANLGDLTGYINRANELGCAADATYFRPNATSSRGEAFKIAACVAGLEIGGETNTGSTNTGNTSTGTVASGALTVSLNSTPAAQYVPYNASSVKVGTVTLTATKGDVIVSSVAVSRSGLGPVNDIDNVALAQSGVVVSNNAPMNSSTQIATVRLSPTLTVKAGTSVSLDVIVSLKSSAQPNSQHQFTLTAVNSTNAVATGTPLTLGLLNTTSYSVGTATVDSLTPTAVVSGKAGQRFMNVKLSVNKDATINGFTLTRSAGEDATKAFANLAVYRNSVRVGTATVTTDKIIVSGLNTSLLNGETADYELRGDVVYVGAASSITFKVENTSDVSATEKATGYTMTTGNTPITASAITLPAVQLTWTKTSTGSKTVAPGASSVTLFEAKYSADASFDVTSFTIAGNSADALALNTATLAQAQFSRLTLTVAGVDYDMLTLTNPANTTFSNTSDRFSVDSGSPVIVKIVGTLKSSASSPKSYRYTATINTVKNNQNGSTVTPTNNAQTGDTVNVMNGKATIKAAAVAGPSTKKISANQTRTEIGRFSVLAEAEDINVRKLVITNSTPTGSLPLSLTDIADLTQLISGNSVRLVDVDTNTDVSAVATVAAGSITLDSMNIQVQKDVTKTFKLVVDTTALTSLTSPQTKFTMRIAPITAGDITRVSGGNADVAGSVVATSNTTGEFVAGSSTYTAGKVPPTVLITKSGTDLDTYVVTIRNIDSENAMDINTVTLKAKARFAGSTTVTWDGMACVRNGSTGQCNVSGLSTATQDISTANGATFTLAGTIPNLNLVKNTGTVSFNVYVPNLPALIPNDTLEVAVTTVGYDSTFTEDYTNVSGSKVTATK
jgi:hypothetical protein